MKKILISVIIDLFKINGTSIRAKRIANILKNYYDVTVITRSDKKNNFDDLEYIDINVIHPSETKLWNFKLIPQVMHEKPDFVYCTNDYFGFITYYLLSKIYHYPIIFEAHAIMSQELKGRNVNKIKLQFYTLLEQFVMKHADFIVALSGNTYNFYKKYNNKIELVTNFIDEDLTKNFAKQITTSEDSRSNIKNVGLIGPFDNFSNEYFLEFVYKNLERFDDNIIFNVIGNCDNKIKSQKIKYIGFIKSFEDYMYKLASLDAVLLPSKIPTGGPLTKIIEPMACCCPVITTQKGIVGLDNIENNEDILIFEEDKLVEGLNRSLSNDELMFKIGINARNTFEKYYSRKTNEDKLLNIFKRME